MKFWNDMQTKSGFGDGDACPVGVEVYRRAYILTVNAIAERLQSTVRAVAFDRPGVHNWCLIYRAALEATKPYTTEQLATGEAPDLCPGPGGDICPDEAMEKAIYMAHELSVDSYITTRISLSKTKLTALLEAAVRADVGV